MLEWHEPIECIAARDRKRACGIRKALRSSVRWSPEVGKVVDSSARWQPRVAVTGLGQSSDSEGDGEIASEEEQTSEEVGGQEETPRDAEEGLEVPRADSAGIDVDIEEEAETQRALRDPGLPSKQERDEHALTHLPFRPWCDACIKGRAKDKMSLRFSEVYAGGGVPRVRMDYCYITEKTDDGTDQDPNAGDSVTVLVMQESKIGRAHV